MAGWAMVRWTTALAVLAVVLAACVPAHFSAHTQMALSAEDELPSLMAAVGSATFSQAEKEIQSQPAIDLAEPAESESCVGNELSRVMGSCAVVVLTGRTPEFESGCCIALRTLSLPCLCAQVSSSSFANAIPSSTTSAIAASCVIAVPTGIPCAGFNT